MIEAACNEAYLPFLEVLSAFPDLRINIHYSGVLLEWLLENRPDVIEALTANKQHLEWMGGGFYEPILPAIPENDRLDQLRRMQDFLGERLDIHPRGAWIAERVWHPSLAGTLNRAGFEYTVVDDSAFSTTRLDPANLSGPYAVDSTGRTMLVFPISESLRYAIPNSSVEEVISMLRRMHDHDPDRLLVFADDGEKFGHWDGSGHRLYADGWLADFFSALSSADWIEMTTFEALTEAAGSRPHVSLPPSSYREMDEWSGGSFDNFADRYAAVAVLDNKMTRLSRQLRRASSKARTGLLRSQCNCAWWHGSYGGVYLPHLRASVHESMIDARVIHDGDQHRGRGWHELDTIDWDCDWDEEIHVELPDQSWVLDPRDGGSLHYFDDKPGRWAVSDVMTRVAEPYHPASQITDQFPHRWLADRLVCAERTAADLAEAGNEEPQHRYQVVAASGGKGTVDIVLETADQTITKSISATDRRLEVQYQLAEAQSGRFGPRLPISVWDGAAEMRVDGGAWMSLDEIRTLLGHRFRFRHTGRDLEVVVSSPMPSELFIIPIRSQSQNENGMPEDIFQGVELWPHFNTSGTGTFELTIEIGAAQ